MIRLISGAVAYTEGADVVVAQNGIGYLIHTSGRSAHRPTETVTLHTHLAIRENAHDLYGFETRDELEVFELLMTIPKIGPKSALAVLSQADITLLKEAVRTNDPTRLSKLSGIGAKSAEKIVAGLKEVFERRGIVDESTAPDAAFHAEDVIDALVTLGYAPYDARKAILAVHEQDPSLTSSSDIIKAALRTLG